MYHHAFEAMPFPRFIPEKWKRPCKIVYHLMLFVTSTTKNLREEKWHHIVLRCPFIASMVVHYMQRPFLGWWHNKGHISREWMQRHFECDTQFKVKNELFVAFPRYFDNKCNKRKSFPLQYHLLLIYVSKKGPNYICLLTSLSSIPWKILKVLVHAWAWL